MERFQFNANIPPPNIYNMSTTTNRIFQQPPTYPDFSRPPPMMCSPLRIPAYNTVDFTRPPPRFPIRSPNTSFQNFNGHYPRFTPFNIRQDINASWPSENLKPHLRASLNTNFTGYAENTFNGFGSKRKFSKERTQFVKKQKIDKRDLPQNNKFVCENCDKGFKNVEPYNIHIATHVKCKVEDCKYVAHPKLVQIHFETQHRSGLAKKIWKLDSDEDIQKWRDERKKNYPSAENIERKKKERKEKIERGEIIENKYFGKMRGKQRGRVNNQWRNQNQRHRYGDVKNDDNNDNDGNGFNSDNKKACEDFLNEVDHLNNNTKNESNELPLEVSNNSCSKIENSDNKDLDSHLDNSTNDSCKNNSYKTDSHDNDSFSEIKRSKAESKNSGNLNNDVKTGVSNDETAKNITISRRRTKARKKKAKRKDNPDVKPNLLEMLLANDIRKERNAILQCIKYVVQNLLPNVEAQENGL